jgi:regulator of PEP synthase PpsR (kinase-PPPase family)
MMHDDGQLADDLEEADVVLIGVSRTSMSLYATLRMT